LQAVRGPSIQHAQVSLDLAGRVLRVAVRALVNGLGLEHRVREDSVGRDLVVRELFLLQAKLLVRSVRQEDRVGETSSIPRPRKAR
jgi:hypothetical protein